MTKPLFKLIILSTVSVLNINASVSYASPPQTKLIKSKKIEGKIWNGIFWGAFNPPTDVHFKIITKATEILSLNKMVIVVNNHSYKKYKFPLESRIKTMKYKLDQGGIKNFDIHSQDDQKMLGYAELKLLYPHEELCAISGYDSYYSWSQFSTSEERGLFSKIAVIPRGDVPPTLFDDHAFLLPIGDEFSHVSSTKIRQGILDGTINEQDVIIN